MPHSLANELVVTIPFDKPRLEDFPDWFVQRKNLAWDRALALPFPARTDQGWRFSSLNVTRMEEARLGEPEFDLDEVLAHSTGFEKPAGRMVFVNDTCIHHSCHAAGVIWVTLEEALKSHEAVLKEHFMARPPELGSEKFLALHEAMLKTAAVCIVPKGVEIDQPLEIVRWHSGSQLTSFPHTLVIAEPNARVSILESFRSLTPEEPGYVFGVNDLAAGEGARIHYAGFQDWGPQVNAFHLNATELTKDASIIHLAVNLGGKSIRGESVSRLLGPGSRSDMLAVNVAEDHQEYDQRTLQDHASPDTTSDLLYKNCLSDTSRTIFSGLIKVQPGSHRTDAYQKARNLLLSDEAEANSMPGLEILADDVRCSHGATSGEIDRTELFYMMSRGIDEKQARRLIAFGFLNEALQRFPNSDKDLVEYLTRQLEGHLAKR